MIKRFIRRVLGLSANHMERVPRDALSPAAAKVCAVLREAGFSSYVVGGAVRDLLLGIAPKDFDVATDARPEQIKPLFRRALIIGRRFRLVRVIGDPATRYREDPVRMLRGVRLAAKLGLTLEAATREPIRSLAPLMERVPPARLFDVILEQPLGERFVTLALAQTDERVLAERPVSPAFLFAALLWHEVLAAWRAREARGERSIPALENAMDEVLDTQCAKLAITRKLTATMREVWSMQPRFDLRSGQRPHRMLEAPRFRMAYDFLALRAASGEVPADLEAWWRAFAAADAETRQAMLLPETGPGKRRRRRRKKRPGTPTPAPA